MAYGPHEHSQPRVDCAPTARRGRGRVQKGVREPVRRSARVRELQAKLDHYQVESICVTRKINERPNNKKRKRANSGPSDHRPTEPERKRTRHTFRRDHSDDADLTTITNDPIDYWCKHNFRWPHFLFQSGSMQSFLAKKRSSNSLRRKQSALGSLASGPDTPSDQQEESKSVKYQDPRFRLHAESEGIFLGKYVQGLERGPTSASEELCQKLLDNHPSVPTCPDCPFSDESFEETCEIIEDRNEAKVVQDISRLIVPSPQALARAGMSKLRCLIESVNERWNNCIPLLSPRPQPDFSVGYKKTAFSDEQRRRLQPLLGELTDTSYYMGTYYMLFPFLTSEVKCGAGALDFADRQNVHSAAVAVRAVVQLFRLVHRENELHRDILAFSISHNDRSVRIYGHFPAINGENTTYHRHLIREFSFTEQRGREKWTAYKFTKSIFEQWVPSHLARIGSAVDQIPIDLDFSVSQGSDPPSSDSQSEPNSVDQSGTTPDTSLSQGSKRAKRKHTKQ